MKTVILKGAPGVGKTSFPEYYANQIGAKFLYYLCHEWTTNEELLYSIDVGKVVEKMKNPYKAGILKQAIEISRKNKVVIVIDELDKAREKVDTLLLDFAQNCRINYHDNKLISGFGEHIYLFITTNDNRELSDPLLRRGFKYHMNSLPRNVENNILLGDRNYFLDDERKFMYKFLTEIPNVVENEKLANLILKIASKLRNAKNDVSVSELKNFYDTLFLADNVEEVKMCIYGWLCRNEDYVVSLNKSHRSIESLSNDVWRELNPSNKQQKNEHEKRIT